jgi:hypothetical protein
MRAKTAPIVYWITTINRDISPPVVPAVDKPIIYRPFASNGARQRNGNAVPAFCNNEPTVSIFSQPEHSP